MKEEKVMLMAEEVEPVISKEHGLSSNQLLHICQKKIFLCTALTKIKNVSLNISPKTKITKP